MFTIVDYINECVLVWFAVLSQELGLIEPLPLYKSCKQKRDVELVVQVKLLDEDQRIEGLGVHGFFNGETNLLFGKFLNPQNGDVVVDLFCSNSGDQLQGFLLLLWRQLVLRLHDVLV